MIPEKFDYIIQNPPYKRGLHLEFMEKGYDLLTDTGKMIIIHPATWLINVRTTGKADKYNKMKEKYTGHVSDVHIENLNREFNIDLFVPLSIEKFHKEYIKDEVINFNCCGEQKKVKRLHDCNLIGDYDVIQSIIKKCTAYGDLMKDHIFDVKKYSKEHEK